MKKVYILFSMLLASLVLSTWALTTYIANIPRNNLDVNLRPVTSLSLPSKTVENKPNLAPKTNFLSKDSYGNINNLLSRGWVFKNASLFEDTITRNYWIDFVRKTPYQNDSQYLVLLEEELNDTAVKLTLYLWNGTTFAMHNLSMYPNVSLVGSHIINWNASISAFMSRAIWVNQTVEIYLATSFSGEYVNVSSIIFSLTNRTFYNFRDLKTISLGDSGNLEDFEATSINQQAKFLILARSIIIGSKYYLNVTLLRIDAQISSWEYNVKSIEFRGIRYFYSELGSPIMVYINNSNHIFVSLSSYVNYYTGFLIRLYHYDASLYLLYIIPNGTMRIITVMQESLDSIVVYYSLHDVFAMDQDKLYVLTGFIRYYYGDNSYNLSYALNYFVYDFDQDLYNYQYGLVIYDNDSNIRRAEILDYEYNDSEFYLLGLRYTSNKYLVEFSTVYLNLTDLSISRSYIDTFYRSEISVRFKGIAEKAKIHVLLHIYDSENYNLSLYLSLGLQDSDRDYLSDLEETAYGTNISNPDSDSDYIWDGSEMYVYKTNPLSNDTDGDNLIDGQEIIGFDVPDVGIRRTNPVSNDTDNDNVPDNIEVLGRTFMYPYHNITIFGDPLNPDTDGDGLNDYFEMLIGWDLTVRMQNGTILKYHVYSDPTRGDFDGDDIPDLEEENVSDPWRNDTDLDGLSDYSEIKVFKTNITNGDTDFDGAGDSQEVYGVYIEPLNKLLTSNPLINDSDGDGLLDGLEMFVYQTNPLDTDTDRDGLSDKSEVVGVNIAGNYNTTDPLNPDTDGDGLLDGEEVYYRSLPWSIDSDNDGLTDYYEVTNGTSPMNPDTDGDGLSDYYEVVRGYNPLSIDTDGDNLNDSYEEYLGTNPISPDTDNDKLSDGEEVLLYHTDPLLNDTDEDGLSDYLEAIIFNTDPLNRDSDGDGLSDGDELGLGLNPLDRDSDGDGLSDGDELSKGLDPKHVDSDYDLLPDSIDPLPLLNNFVLIIPAVITLIIFGAYTYGLFRNWRSDILGVGLADKGGIHMFTLPQSFEEKTNTSLISSGLLGIVGITQEITSGEIELMVLEGPIPVIVSVGEHTIMWSFVRKSYPRIKKIIMSTHKKLETIFGETLASWEGMADLLIDVKIWLAKKLKIRESEQGIDQELIEQFEKEFEGI